MLKKGSKLYSILTGTCPKCHEESMYIVKNSYILSKVFDMYEKCGHCNQKYKIEPSFFFGAMFVSYGVSVLIGIVAFLVSYFGFQTNLKMCFVCILVSLTILMPVIMRISRNIWVNFFIHFDQNWVAKR